jgi:hypothetical protein
MINWFHPPGFLPAGEIDTGNKIRKYPGIEIHPGKGHDGGKNSFELEFIDHMDRQRMTKIGSG